MTLLTQLLRAELAGKSVGEWLDELRGPVDLLIGARSDGELVIGDVVAAEFFAAADRIAAMDRGYLRRYFPRLKQLRLS